MPIDNRLIARLLGDRRLRDSAIAIALVSIVPAYATPSGGFGGKRISWRRTSRMAQDHNPFEPGDRFHVGGADSERIEVRVLSRSSAEDYWDGNWLSCEISLRAGGFVGRCAANLRTDELERFFTQLQSLYSTLRGTAAYESMEEQLQLSLEGDGRGHISCKAEVRDVAGTGNLLTFHLQFDQTQLFATIATLGELLNRYPVRGSPTA